jgi:hypothetical protein
LGAKAGALAPWLTHQVLADTAGQIALTVHAAHPQDQTEWRVLVTGDANVLGSDVQARSVRDALIRRKADLGHYVAATKQATTELDRVVTRYTHTESDNGLGIRSGGRRAEPPFPVQSTAGDRAVKGTAKGNGAGRGAESHGTVAAGAGQTAELVRLVATDFSVTAADVPVESSLLSVLVAGALSPGAFLVRESFDPVSQVVIRAVADAFAQAAAKPDVTPARVQQAARRAFNQAQQAARAQVKRRAETVHVLLDSFAATAENSPTFASLHALAEQIDELDTATLELRKKIVRVTADLADRRAQLDKSRQDWAEGVTANQVPQPRLSMLEDSMDTLTGEVAARESAVGPAQAVLDQAVAAAEVARADLTTATTPDATGLSPVARACAREALHGTGAITHVLYVHTAQAGADVISRRSVLGSSGRVSYLGAVTAAWALLDVYSGAVVAGGSTERARQLTHDLTTGKTSPATDVTTDAKQFHKDPLAWWETAFRIAVLTLAAVLAVLGMAAAAALLWSTFT